MDISDYNFRDNTLTQITISYDLDSSEGCADLTIKEREGSTVSYRISGLTEYSIYEDFQCIVIGQCKFINSQEGISLLRSIQ